MSTITHGFDVGDRVTITTTFTIVAGVPMSPSTLYADYLRPGDAAATEIDPTDEGDGVVSFTLPTFDVPGSWLWYVAGTAGVIAADQGEIVVAPKLTGGSITI